MNKDPAILDECIKVTQSAVDARPETDDAELFFALGFRLQTRYDLNYDCDDLRRAISAFQRAVALTSDSDQKQVEQLFQLGKLLLSYFQRMGGPDNLVRAIDSFERVVQLLPDDDPNKPGALNNYGMAWLNSFEEFGNDEDLNHAISAIQLAIQLTPEGHQDSQLASFRNLGHLLLSRFWRKGQLDDLEQSIAINQRALDLTPNDHPDRPALLTNLAYSLLSRYERDGQLADVERSIEAYRHAIESTSDDHPDKPSWLNDLGHALLARFEHSRESDDVEHSISARRRALELAPDDHVDRPGWISNYGNSLFQRFGISGDLGDVDQAVIAHKRSVELTPEDHPRMSRVLSSLGNSLLSRFEHKGSKEMDDIEQSVVALQRAFELTPDDHPDKAARLNNVGLSLRLRFECDGRLDDLNQSIASHRCAIDLTPTGHATLSGYLEYLGMSLSDLCKSAPTQSTFDAAIQSYMDSTTRPLGAPSIRLRSAMRCIEMHSSYPMFSSIDSLLLAHSRIILVLPEVVWLGHHIHRRFEESAKLGELVNAAVSTAITADSLKSAIEWLEAGRAIIWSQVLSLRAPLDDLQRRHPDLADTLRTLQRKLQQSVHTSSARDGVEFLDVPGMMFNTGADRHRRLASDYDAILKQIRDCVGFEDFLRPRRFAALVPFTEHADGPVVFLNVAVARCDAVGVLPDGTITAIPLPELSLERASQLRTLWADTLKGNSIRERREANMLGATEGHLDNYEPIKLGPHSQSLPSRHSSRVPHDNPVDIFPEHMWEWIVKPVLEGLQLMKTTFPGRLPHITWCPTGPLTQLPLHAAGLYSQKNGPRAFDFIVSSYTPSLSTLQRCYAGAAKQNTLPSTLIVTQPASPGHTRLPQTTAEGICVAQALRDSQMASTIFDDEQATVDAVRSIVDQYSWVHLACHGAQHPGDATQSAFTLYDGPLSLSDLMRTVADDAELAFLSACQTATGDAGNPEESAHLAAGMLAVGFKGVVATMWSIMDEDAPVVVEAYYKKLIELRNSGVVGKGQTGAAYALHEAVAKLREEVGEENFGRWAPFVHFGV